MSSIQWPTAGSNSKFLIMDIPLLPPTVIREALEFISTRCCYKYTTHHTKFLSFPSILRDIDCKDDPVVLEQLFIDPIGIENNETINLDPKRFQTSPSDQDKIRESKAIIKIVDDVTTVVNANANKPYVSHKISIIYSRPFGEPQGIHQDDYRDVAAIEQEGEMISVIVALMDNTKLDIKNNNGERKTYSIPSGTMFLFSGSCEHGGSSYTVSNARLHIEFIPRKECGEQLALHNLIQQRYFCPIDACPLNDDGSSFPTKSRLYDHWRKKHLCDEGISVGKYIAMTKGKTILLCQTCKKGFTSKKGLSRHQKRCKGLRNVSL